MIIEKKQAGPKALATHPSPQPGLVPTLVSDPDLDLSTGGPSSTRHSVLALAWLSVPCTSALHPLGLGLSLLHSSLERLQPPPQGPSCLYFCCLAAVPLTGPWAQATLRLPPPIVAPPCAPATCLSRSRHVLLWPSVSLARSTHRDHRSLCKVQVREP